VTPPPADYEVAIPRNGRKNLGNIPTTSEASSTSFRDHPFPGPVVRGKELATGGDDCNKEENLANRRNTKQRESVAVPYELPTSTKTKGDLKSITTDETCVKDSTAVQLSSETGHANQQLQLQKYQGNDDRTFQGDYCMHTCMQSASRSTLGSLPGAQVQQMISGCRLH
jgi:hypothetical protein